MPRNAKNPQKEQKADEANYDDDREQPVHLTGVSGSDIQTIPSRINMDVLVGENIIKTNSFCVNPILRWRLARRYSERRGPDENNTLSIRAR